jgi:hypothetical protein
MDLLTEPEAAAAMRMSVKSLYRRRRAGAIGFIQDEGRILYRQSHLEDYLAAREQEATTKPPERRVTYRRAGARGPRNAAAVLAIV